jgi:hypothetical protein
MDGLRAKRELAESLIGRMDEILPPFVFARPTFAVPRASPVVPVAAALVKELEPVLDNVESQLQEISASRMTLKDIGKQLALIRSNR